MRRSDRNLADLDGTVSDPTFDLYHIIGAVAELINPGCGLTFCAGTA